MVRRCSRETSHCEAPSWELCDAERSWANAAFLYVARPLRRVLLVKHLVSFRHEEHSFVFTIGVLFEANGLRVTIAKIEPLTRFARKYPRQCDARVAFPTLGALFGSDFALALAGLSETTDRNWPSSVSQVDFHPAVRCALKRTSADAHIHTPVSTGARRRMCASALLNV